MSFEPNVTDPAEERPTLTEFAALGLSFNLIEKLLALDLRPSEETRRLLAQFKIQKGDCE
jgi:hypothetical protein